MTYRELIQQLDALTDQQKDQQVVAQIGDEENVELDVSIHISEHDIYHDHGDSYGTIEDLKADYPEEWEDMLDDLDKTPAGAVFIFINKD